MRRRADGSRLPRKVVARLAARRRVDDRDSYRGFRRWPEPVRRRLLFGGVLIALTFLILAGLALRFPEEVRRLADLRRPDGVAGGPGTTSAAPEEEPSPTPKISPTISQTPETAALPAFMPIQIEAEDTRNSVTGGAQRVSYGTASGGRLVRDIGTPPGGSPGGLSVPVSVPDAGQYNVIVRIAFPEGPATLTLVVTVSGSVPVAVPVTGRSLCCSNGSVTLGLQAGTNWINFGNPTGRGPAIDFIQITRSGK